jgi:hypothetical protein
MHNVRVTYSRWRLFQQMNKLKTAVVTTSRADYGIVPFNKENVGG